MARAFVLPLAFVGALLPFGCDNSKEPVSLARTDENVVLDEGCPHREGGSCSSPPSSSGSDEAKRGGKTAHFGAPLRATQKVALTTLLSEPDAFHGKEVRVSGTVRRACSRRGCWMEIAPSGDEEAAGCRVTFKDYGFLVPTDSAGSRAEMDAIVQVTDVSAEAVAHYESEGARFVDKSPNGTAREVRLVASGVELTRKKDG